ALGHRGVQDLPGRHHHAEVDDLVVVAGEHDADDVLADVVHVTLDRGEHDLALRPPPTSPSPSTLPAIAQRLLLLGLHERLEVGHRALHHPAARDYLRQEHPAPPAQHAHHPHPVPPRPL